MCSRIPEMLPESDPSSAEELASQSEKAMRWLGYVQGVLSVTGVRTVAEMRSDNRGES
jgi:hypothetical protein